MELKLGSCLLLILFVAACGTGQISPDAPSEGKANGTEITNPVGAGEMQQKKFESEIYTLTVDVLPDWHLTEYGLDSEIEDLDAFKAEDAQTRIIAHFTKKNAGYFSIFEGIFKEGETLQEYVRARRPIGDLDIQDVNDPDGSSTQWIFFDQQSDGPHGGYELDVYLTMEGAKGTLWMRAELVGSNEEKEKTWKEFWSMVSTLKVKQGEHL